MGVGFSSLARRVRVWWNGREHGGQLFDLADAQRRADLAAARTSGRWWNAVEFLRASLTLDVQASVRRAIAADPANWSVPYHLSWGMAIRNLLRSHGYGEREFGVLNLDNIYAELVVDAVTLEAPDAVL